MKEDKQVFISKIIDSLTLEQKVGQCMVLGLAGVIINPALRRWITEINPSGLCVCTGLRAKNPLHDPYAGGQWNDRIVRQPKDGIKDMLKGIRAPSCSHQEWCSLLNELKQLSLDSGAGLPLHANIDVEGNMNADYNGDGVHVFPHPMGLARSGDPQLAYDVAWAVARQLTPLGVNWINSPVLGVNTEPMNPEITTRSYGEDPDLVAEYALAGLKGYQEGGLIATGKHFPGRGASAEDAHAGLPVIDLPEAELQRHLIPFKACIDAGLPAIMTAHTVYPAYDPDVPATLSRRILTDLLKGELGFEGAVMTDAMGMGGILQRWTLPQAATMALNAGVDLILIRDEGGIVDEVVAGVIEAARRGDLPQERLDDAVRRSLSVKYDYGVFENGNLRDPGAAGEGINDPKVAEIQTRAAKKTTSILRDEAGVLPLDPSQKVLLVEQLCPLHAHMNNMQLHPGVIWKKMLERSQNVGMVETTMAFTDEDRQRIVNRLDEADTLVVTNWYYRRCDSGNEFIKDLHSKGKKVIVLTNNPYPLTVLEEYKTVVLTFGLSAPAIDEIVGKLYGE